MLPVAVLAGGLGNRLQALTGDALPKALVPVLGRPFIDWKLEGLATSGARRVVLLVGHHGSQIRDHVGDGGQYGLSVDYVDDGPVLLGTGGALVRALPFLADAFWVTYGDTLLEFDVAAAEAQFAESGARALMTVLHNQNRFEPSNVQVRDRLVIAYGKQILPRDAEHIDYGMLAFQSDAIAAFDPLRGPFDLLDVLNPLIARRSVAAFEVIERFRDIGTVDALRETEAFLAARDGHLPRPTGHDA